MFVLEDAVAEIERRAVALASELIPEAVPLCLAGLLHVWLVREARAIAAAKALLTPRVAASREWQRSGHRSAEEALAARTGTSLSAAKTTMATGKALADNPTLRSAMARGEVSADQGSVIADAAQADPSATDKLIATAKTANMIGLRAEAGRIKAAADRDPDATYRRLHRARRLSRHTASDGSRHLHLQGPVDLVSIVEAELDRCLSHHIRTMAPGGVRESHDTMAFDAAVAMARRSARADQPPTRDPQREGSASPARADGTTDSSGGARSADERRGRTPTPAGPTATGADAGVAAASPATTTAGPTDAGHGPGSQPPDGDPEGSSSRQRRRRATLPPPEHLALLRIDIEALWRGHVESDEICEVAGIGSFPVSAARRLLGDAVVKLIITRGEDVANVTSLTRGPTQGMRYAKLWTNPVCTAISCSGTVLEYDHPYGVEYRRTRHTRLDELDGLCHAHHALRTHRDWALVPGTGRRPMVAPTDPRHPRNTPLPDRSAGQR